MDALAPLLVAWSLLVIPGLVLLWAVRSRLPFLPGHAPAISCLALFALSRLYRLFGIPWTTATVMVGTALVLAATVGVAAALGRFAPMRTRSGAGPDADPMVSVESRATRQDATGPRPRGAEALLVAGAVSGAALLVIPSLHGMGSLRILNGSYDAFFHHSALATIRDSGDAFPWTALAPMYEGQATYYPTTWHQIASLVPFDVVPSANAMVLATLAVIPASVIAMLDGIVPHREGHWTRAAVIAALGIGSAAFLSTPTAVLVMGLWPFGLGAALLPAALGAGVQLLVGGHLGRRTRVSAVLVLVGTALTHPSVLVSVAVVAGVSMVVLGASWLGRRRTRRRGIVLLTAAVALAVVFATLSITRLSGMAELTKAEPANWLTPLLVTLADRPRFQDIPFDPLPLAPILVLAAFGALRAILTRHKILLCALGVGLAALFLTYAIYSDMPWLRALTAAWYGARERIHPLFEVGVLVLAAGGALWRPEGIARRMRTNGRRALSAAVCTAIVAGAVLGAVSDDRLRSIGGFAYRAYGQVIYPYVSAAEREFIEEAAARLPEDAVVIGVPQDGTSAFWFLGGVTVTQPSMAPPLTLDVGRVATWGDTIAPGSVACRAAEDLGVTHLYRDEGPFSGEDLGADTEYLYKGYDDFPERYLTPVAEEGSFVLYRIELPTC